MNDSSYPEGQWTFPSHHIEAFTHACNSGHEYWQSSAKHFQISGISSNSVIQWFIEECSEKLTNSFGNRRTSWQLQPCYRVVVKVIDVGEEFHRQRRRRFMTLKNWLVMPTGAEHFDQVSVTVIVWQGTCCYRDTLIKRTTNDSRCKTAFINYSILLSPVVITTLDFVGQIGWPSNVTDWLIGSGTWGL